MVLVETLIHYHRQYYFISAWWENLHKTLSIEKPKRLPMVSASRCFLCCSFSKNAWFRKVHRKFISKVLEWKKTKSLLMISCSAPELYSDQRMGLSMSFSLRKFLYSLVCAHFGHALYCTTMYKGSGHWLCLRYYCIKHIVHLVGK